MADNPARSASDPQAASLRVYFSKIQIIFMR